MKKKREERQRRGLLKVEMGRNGLEYYYRWIGAGVQAALRSNERRLTTQKVNY